MSAPYATPLTSWEDHASNWNRSSASTLRGVAPEAAILDATRNRIRPIFMSTLTSVFGMLPLVIFPGAGSELYRGLGSVVVGGLSMSAVLTLLIVPPMLSLLVGTLEGNRTTLPAARLPDRAEPQPGE